MGVGLGRQWPKAKSERGKRKKRRWAGFCAGLERRKKEDLKEKLFLFFRALKLGQIQMEFEFNLKQPRTTLNQNQYRAHLVGL